MSFLTASSAPRTTRWAGLIAGLSALALLIAPGASAEPLAVESITVVAPPSISGTAQVGSTVSVTGPTWSPDEVATSYQWLRDAQPIPDATAASYLLEAADVGRTISIQATGTKPDLEPVTVVSPPTDPVTKVPATVSVSGASPQIGEVRLTIQVSAPGEPPLTGTAWVKRGTTLLRNQLPITNGQATFTATGVPSGTHTYTVHYRGTDRVGEATGDTVVTTKAKAPGRVTVTGSSTRVGEVRLSIKVTAPGTSGLGGTAWVKRGSTLLRNELAIKNGAAGLTVTKVPSGTHTYTVFYRETSRVTSATGATRVTTKAKARPTIALKPSASPGKVSLHITVTAPGQSALGGAMWVKEGSKLLRSNLAVSKGKATFTATKVRSGTHTYTVGYKGTSQVATGTKAVTVKVPAPVKLVAYPNCAALNKVHPHGVGRAGAKDKVSGSTKPVTTFLVNTKLYQLNTGRDRDKDGIACEKR